MWIPPEDKDPVLRHAPTRQSIACFGAVALRTGKFAHSFSPVFNAVEFEKFLRLLLRRRSPGRRIVVVLDNARYHHAKPLEPFSANAPAFSNCCSSRPTAPTSRQSNESGNWPGDSPRTTSTSRTCKHWSTRSPRVLTHGNIPTPRFGVYAALFKSLCLTWWTSLPANPTTAACWRMAAPNAMPTRGFRCCRGSWVDEGP